MGIPTTTISPQTNDQDCISMNSTPNKWSTPYWRSPKTNSAMLQPSSLEWLSPWTWSKIEGLRLESNLKAHRWALTMFFFFFFVSFNIRVVLTGTVMCPLKLIFMSVCWQLYRLWGQLYIVSFFFSHLSNFFIKWDAHYFNLNKHHMGAC